MPFIKKAGYLGGHEEERRSEIEAAVTLEHEKIKHLTDVPNLIDFFFKDVSYDPASVEKVLKKPDVVEVLKEAAQTFEALPVFTAASTEEMSLIHICRKWQRMSKTGFLMRG